MFVKKLRITDGRPFSSRKGISAELFSFSIRFFRVGPYIIVLDFLDFFRFMEDLWKKLFLADLIEPLTVFLASFTAVQSLGVLNRLHCFFK